MAKTFIKIFTRHALHGGVRQPYGSFENKTKKTASGAPTISNIISTGEATRIKLQGERGGKAKGVRVRRKEQNQRTIYIHRAEAYFESTLQINGSTSAEVQFVPAKYQFIKSLPAPKTTTFSYTAEGGITIGGLADNIHNDMTQDVIVSILSELMALIDLSIIPKENYDDAQEILISVKSKLDVLGLDTANLADILSLADFEISGDQIEIINDNPFIVPTLDFEKILKDDDEVIQILELL